MLFLLGVILSAALSLTSPAPITTATSCPASPLIQETLLDLQALRSKGTSKIARLNKTMEAKGKTTTYLTEFIKDLKTSKETLLAKKLQEIQAYEKSCPGWMEHDWKPVRRYDFFNNLNHFLRFLNQYALPEETT